MMKSLIVRCRDDAEERSVGRFVCEGRLPSNGSIDKRMERLNHVIFRIFADNSLLSSMLSAIRRSVGECS
jgi:hypothetical protein